MKSNQKVFRYNRINKPESLIVLNGRDLEKAVIERHQPHPRWLVKDVLAYINDKSNNSICTINGLERTGKTTLLFNVMEHMGKLDQCVYFHFTENSNLSQACKAIEKMRNNGCRYIFIDEASRLPDLFFFTSWLHKKCQAYEIKAVITGSDTLALYSAALNCIYYEVDDEDMDYESEDMEDIDYEPTIINTTYIPFMEFAEITGIDSLNAYMSLGGILFDKEDSHINQHLARGCHHGQFMLDIQLVEMVANIKYLTLLALNIRNSLRKRYGENPRSLSPVSYQMMRFNGLLTAINWLIWHGWKCLRENIPVKEFQTAASQTVIKKLAKIESEKSNFNMDLVRMQNKSLLPLPKDDTGYDEYIKSTAWYLKDLKVYLRLIGLLDNFSVARPNGPLETLPVFVQPVLFWGFALELVKMLRDSFDWALSDIQPIYEKTVNASQEDVLRGIVFLNLKHALGNEYEIFKFKFIEGVEYDIVVANKSKKRFSIYQVMNNYNSEKIELLSNLKYLCPLLKYLNGQALAGSYVLYNKENWQPLSSEKNKIRFVSVCDFLKDLTYPGM